MFDASGVVGSIGGWKTPAPWLAARLPLGPKLQLGTAPVFEALLRRSAPGPRSWSFADISMPKLELGHEEVLTEGRAQARSLTSKNGELR